MVWTKYVPTYKRLFFYRKTKRYEQTRREFYQSRNLLNTPASFQQVFTNHRSQSQESHKEIKFYGLRFNSTTKECKKCLGKPNFIDAKQEIITGINTYFYRLQIKGVKYILQIHFYKDCFFYAQMEIREGNLKIKKEIRNLIYRKYEIESLTSFGAIIDSNNNQLLLKEDIVQNITYITGNKQILSEIKKDFMNREESKNSSLNQKLQWLIDVM